MHFFSRYLRNLLKISAILGSNFQKINNRGVGGGTIIRDSRVRWYSWYNMDVVTLVNILSVNKSRKRRRDDNIDEYLENVWRRRISEQVEDENFVLATMEASS